MDTDLDTNTDLDTDLDSIHAETSDGMSNSLVQAAASSIDPAVIDIAIDVFKRTCGQVAFVSKGTTYYGVEENDLGDLCYERKPVCFLVDALEQVVEASEPTEPQVSLRDAISLFRTAMRRTGKRLCFRKCQVYFGHARRILARMIVTYQGYYEVHPDQVKTFKTMGRVGKRGGRSPPADIAAIYKWKNHKWTPLRILTWQLSGLSKALSRRVAELLRPSAFTQTQWSTDSRSHGSAMVSDDLATGAGRSGLSVRRATRNTKRTSSMNSTKCQLTASTESVETRPKNSVTKLLNRVWPLSSRTVLEGLASSCLQDDLPSTQGKAMIKRLVSGRQLRQLRENHKQYLTEILLRGLDQGDQDPYTYLAVLLGFFDWIRANGIDAEAVLPSPDDNGGELYEELYNRGIALTLQPQGI
jgi:hypothetical protein